MKYPRLLLSLFVFGVVGCSTTASIRTEDGRRFEGIIQGTNENQLFMKVEEQSQIPLRFPKLMAFDRNDIEVIDHPGNLHLVAGAILVGVSTTSVILTLIRLFNHHRRLLFWSFLSLSLLKLTELYSLRVSLSRFGEVGFGEHHTPR